MASKACFNFSQTPSLTAFVDFAVSAEMMKELWSGFCFRSAKLNVENGEKGKISIGTAQFCPLDKDDEFTVCVTENGVGILGRDPAGLMRGFCTLIQKIETAEEGKFRIPAGETHGRFSVRNRMIHLCVFPDTTLFYLRRMIRLCGVLAYTHIIIEFWGMYRYRCLDALAWENAYTEEELRPLIGEAKALGMEVIPMMNQLGHAAASRISAGKHVVLDRYPELQYLFTPDGWCWNIGSERVQKLLADVRGELYDLCGEGHFFHIGCDEAHIFSSGYYPIEDLAAYIRKLTSDVVGEGRRPILWGDMMIPLDINEPAGKRHDDAEAQAKRMKPMLDALDPHSIVADWHYDVKKAPVETSVRFKKAGYDVIGCPWDHPANIDAHVKTAELENLYGCMMTTWHTLHTGVQEILYFARRCGLPGAEWSEACGHEKLEIATLLRRVSPEGRTPYSECGFLVEQVSKTLP